MNPDDPVADLFWRVVYALGIALSVATPVLLVAAGVKVFLRRREAWPADDRRGDEDEPHDPADGVLDYAAPSTPTAEPDFWAENGDAREDDGSNAPATLDYASPRPPGPRDRTARLLSTSDVFHADLLSAKLAEAGIWSHVAGHADAVGAVGVPATTITVIEAKLDRAREVVEQAEAQAAENRARREGGAAFNEP